MPIKARGLAASKRIGTHRTQSLELIKMHISKKLDPDVANWVIQSIGKGAKLTSIIPAKGATSSSVYFIKSTTGKYSLDCVLRLFTNQDWLEEEPDLAEHEASVLIEASCSSLNCLCC